MANESGSKRMARVTGASLAQQLGVSAASVSYALRGRPGISDELRARILEEAQIRGLPIHPAAYRCAQSATIGLILADVINPYYSELAITVTDAARSYGHEVFISQTSDNQDSIDAAVNAMITRHVDGMVLTVSRADDASLLRQLRGAHIPFVQLSRRALHAEADFVGIDDAAAGAEAARHMVEHGYRRIAIIAGPPLSSASRARAEGYRSVLKASGIALPRDWNITAGLNEADGIHAAEYLLGQATLPEAVVCGTDSIALGLISALTERGFHVPGDIAVIGFDGLASARNHLVDLTTVVQPRLEMASKAIELVLTRITNPNRPATSIHCNHTLYIGKSCGCPGRKD